MFLLEFNIEALRGNRLIVSVRVRSRKAVTAEVEMRKTVLVGV